MWNFNISYADASNFLKDKSTFSASLQSVAAYMGQFIEGSGTLDVTVNVAETGTGRFSGGGAVYLDHSAGGLNYVIATAAKELAGGSNANAGQADLTIGVDPSSDYFSALSFDGQSYLAERTVPANKTDGQTVLLHEIMHGLGINTYRDYSTGAYNGSTRTLFDGYTVQSGNRYLLDMPTFAEYGLAPLELTSTSATQNYAHLGNLASTQSGYLDDIMNGIYFYTGQRYYMSQIDLMMLRDLGYKVTIPADLALSYSGLTGDVSAPTVTAPLAAAASNALRLSGTAAPGAMTSILEHGRVLATTKADAAGLWSLDVVTDPALASTSLVVRDGSNAADSAALALERGNAGLRLFASERYGSVKGGAGDDLVTPGARSVAVDGGAGTDTVAYSGARGAYTVAKTASGYSVAGLQGTDTLAAVERLKFSDGMVALDVGTDGLAGQAYRIYQAAFDRAPDAAGLGFWIAALDGGVPQRSVAKDFAASPEFQQLYGSKPSNAHVLDVLYRNVLHRAPDAEGYAFWLDALDRKLDTVGSVLAQFSESPENQANLAAVIGNGFSYTPYG